MAGLGTQPDQDWEPTWNTYVGVQDADATATAVADAGGTVVMAPFDIGPAGRMAVFAEPQGADFCVWQAGTTPGAGLVNASARWCSTPCTPRDLPGAVRSAPRCSAGRWRPRATTPG